MSPAMTPFDPESGTFPPVLESLFARPAATVPAVLLVAGPEARRSGWAARAALAVASAWAARRRGMVLADLETAAPVLHTLLGAENTEGLADVFEFGVSLGRVAHEVGRAFRFVPPGPYVPDPAGLFRHPHWERLVSHFAEEQATLLIYIPARADGIDMLARRAGKAIVLAGSHEAARITASIPSGCAIEVVLCPPEAPAPREEAEPVPAPAVELVFADPVSSHHALEEPTFIRRTRPRRPTSPLLWVALLLTLALGGWVGAEEYLDLDLAPQLREQARKLALDVRRRFGLATPEPERALQPQPEPEPQPEPAVQPKPIEAPAPFSVPIEAHTDYALAQERVASLRHAEPGVVFFLTPVVVDSVLYYRVLAGAAADSASATALLELLVERGHKTEVDAWALRPTVWTFHLGDFESRDSVAVRTTELANQGVPTYWVEVPYTVGLPRFRLYAGAYEGPAQAEVMAHILRAAGVTAPLVRRTGRPVE